LGVATGIAVRGTESRKDVDPQSRHFCKGVESHVADDCASPGVTCFIPAL
jgi:hypothetical protein